MTIKTTGILLGTVWCAAAAPTSFETHYLNLGPGGHTLAIAASPVDGSVFIVAVAELAYGVFTNRVIKTDAFGNPIAKFDFSFGAPSTTPNTITPNTIGLAGPKAAAVDPQGNLLLAGGTSPADFPATAQVGSALVGTAAFVVRIDSNLTRVMNGVLLGGSSSPGVVAPYGLDTTAMALASDAAGNVYVTGSTNALDFPVSPGAFQSKPPRPFSAGAFAFVTKLSPDLTKIVFSTYYGNDGDLCLGSACVFKQGQTVGRAIAVDALGAVTIGGVSDAELPGNPDAPSTGPMQSYALPWYAFVARFSPDGA